MSHTIEMMIHWGDTDAAGLIYYPQFFHYTVIGVNEYFSPAVGDAHPMEWLRKHGLYLPAVETSASFHTPISAGDSVSLETAVRNVGESSITVSFDIKTVTENDVVADLEVTFVFVDTDFHAKRIPPAFKACIEDRGDTISS